MLHARTTERHVKRLPIFSFSAVSKNETYLCSCGFSAWIMDTNPLSRKKDTFLPFGDSLPSKPPFIGNAIMQNVRRAGTELPCADFCYFLSRSKRPEPSPMRDGSLAIHIVAGTGGTKRRMNRPRQDREWWMEDRW